MVKKHFFSMRSPLKENRESSLFQRMCLLLFFFMSVSSMAVGQTFTGYLAQGTVLDEFGETLIGVSVRVKERPSEGTSTDLNGKFAINVRVSETLIFSYIGKTTKEVKIKEGVNSYSVVLEDDNTLEEVVVEAGIIQRNALGFTGSYRTVGKEELKTVSGTNVLQTLTLLDPSFAIATNNLMGSDPNTLANISMRGGSTMNFRTEIDDYSSNPNEPLFVLDGFETDLQTINDLDINRIESITLLKDAGSTAIYGSKGANGVIVVETIKPKEGQIMIEYGGTMKLAWADLSDYKMMNAAEKLEFEALAGRYGNLEDYFDNYNSIDSYNTRKAAIAEGVDTYWLKEPVKNAVSHTHSLNISGGSKELLYQIGANYNKQDGVMKDNYRETFGGNTRITYRKDNMSVSNDLRVSITKSHAGAWGEFKDWANANPYYKMVDEYGNAPRELDSNNQGTAYNPYYNAQLNTMDEGKITTITNNTSFDWFITDQLRWRNSMSLSQSQSNNIAAKDPAHTSFLTKDYTKRGTYSESNAESWKYSLNTSLSYAQSFNEAHNLTFIARASIEETNKESSGFSAEGFPENVPIIPTFSYGYVEDSRPTYSQSTTRMVSLLGSVNYNYKYRYLFDFNYDIDGSSAFGSKKQFQDFYNVGVGWNMDKEAWAEGWKDNVLQELRIKASYGINGNQNVSNVNENVYAYYVGSNVFGTGSYLSQFANPNLKWQVAKKLTANLNATLFNNRLILNFEYYNTKTDPLVIGLAQRLSSGIGSYSVNIGEMNTEGYEFRVNYYFIRNMKDRILLSTSLTGGSYKSIYDGFGDKLEQLNNIYKEQTGVEMNQNLNSLIYYEDGSDVSTIYAVRSLGIDPASGSEVFLTKDGLPTYDYSANHRVAVGETRDKITGVWGVNFTYKRVTANLFFRYRFGAKDFNRSLYNKVENIGNNNIIYNQDRRALYDRWKEVGDIAKYKNIDMTKASNVPITDRFVQKKNEFSGESFKLTYDFSRDAWIKKFGLRDLSVNVSMKDVFIWSTMEQERGLNSPFERSFSVGLNASF